MKYIERKLIWVLLAVSTFLLFKSSDESVISLIEDTALAPVFHQFTNGNSIIFNLSVGYIVSLMFYVIVVVIPEYREKQSLKNELGQAVSFVFEAFFHERRDLGILFHWSKHIVHCKPIDEHLKVIDKFKSDASYERLDAAKANMLVQSVHEVLPTFEQLVPVAFQISHRHAMLWLSMTNSLRQIASLYETPVDERDWGILDLNLGEFVEYVCEFYEVS
ncbi:hypothetical protein ACWOKL_004315 [Vibrio vulnificus]|nr:hypothetical protein [Vibrio vulnificus]EHU0329628.1 hypothetical protein [Vibrio vulnificus]EHU4978572.1 hypothetical protein [Vibrio vulnificus]EII3056874.1 hypothetical protein [Vibrio vulnificus]MCU8448372.1 hypothetical protein [Vibrio vulnificus]